MQIDSSEVQIDTKNKKPDLSNRLCRPDTKKKRVGSALTSWWIPLFYERIIYIIFFINFVRFCHFVKSKKIKLIDNELI